MTKQEFIEQAEQYNGTSALIKVIAGFIFAPEEYARLMTIIKKQRTMKKKHLREYR